MGDYHRFPTSSPTNSDDGTEENAIGSSSSAPSTSKNNPMSSWWRSKKRRDQTAPATLPQHHQDAQAISPLSDAMCRDEQEEMEGLIVQLLATRTYCLPDNNWCQDWIQFFQNCHPVLGLCCAHRLHPMRFKERATLLIASIAFGLAATSIVVLWFHYEGQDMNAVAVEFSTYGVDGDDGGDGGGAEDAARGDAHSVTITHGMIALWTFGGALHSVFDLTVWYITACFCCLRGGCCSKYGGGVQWVGGYIATFITAVAVALALYTVFLRVSVLDDTDGDGEPDEGIESFSFLLGYLIELALTWFCFNFFIGTVLFTGWLGCYRVPVLGGRPFEKRIMDKKVEKIRRKYSHQRKSSVDFEAGLTSSSDSDRSRQARQPKKTGR